MVVKVVVEVSAEEMSQKRKFFPEYTDEEILAQYISENDDLYFQNIEIKIT